MSKVSAEDAVSVAALDPEKALETPREEKLQKSEILLNGDVESEGIGSLSSGGIDAIVKAVDPDDPLHPYHWKPWKKWMITAMYCTLEIYVTWSSTGVVNFLYEFEEIWHCSQQAACMVQSFFIFGNAVGPLLLGPLSDVTGRKWVYVWAMVLFVVFQIQQALARNLATMIIGSFIAGFFGSTALANVAGSIADVFDKKTIGIPMSFFVWGANAGASIGSPISESIIEHTTWRWFYWMNMIVGGVLIVLCIMMPETLPSINIGRDFFSSRLESVQGGARLIVRKTAFALAMAGKIFLTEPIVLCLGLYNGFLYGLTFLYLDGIFDIFLDKYKMSYMGANLTYLNFLVGATVVILIQPIQDYLHRQDTASHGYSRPEARFKLALLLVWLFPISLFWFAFTSNGHIHWICPVIAGGVLSVADAFLWLCMVNYIGESYPSVAGSAIAAFTFPTFIIAGVLVHLGVLMFKNMSSTWAMALLGFVSLPLVALVYVLYFFGVKIRNISKLAAKPERTVEQVEPTQVV